jgi:Na+/H+ antiporter NhaB
VWASLVFITKWRRAVIIIMGITTLTIKVLTIIILQAALNGITEEHQIGHSFEEVMPYSY